MKKIYNKIIFSTLLIIMLFSIETTAFALCKEYNWFLKRNKGKCPGFPEEAKIIEQYDVYYLDKSANQNQDHVIYLTFDAGYENGNIEKILDTLKSESVVGAFFLLDNIILKNTDLVIRMKNEGHYICNHTKNHKNLSNASADEIKKDIMALEAIYEEKTGHKMDKYFRFPEGKYSIEALESVNQLGYKTIFWSFAYDDWDNNRQMDNDKAMKKILDNTHDGAVILLHPTSETNAEILLDLIKEWKSRGYRFGTLDELTN